MTTLTQQLCGALAALEFDDLSQSTVHAAKRGLLDWIGCALVGSDHPALTPLLNVLSRVSSQPVATVFARQMKLGLLDAPVVNGYMGHVLDYDDTHLGGTILHASSPLLAALLALSEQGAVSGRTLLLAYVCGFEAGIRTGQASPGHHRGGWHITGTLGAIAAGVACAKLLGLNAQQITYALGIGATQAAGMQQNRGTMCKYLHAGKAASSGVLAGLLAQEGFDSAADIVEGGRGFCRIYSDTAAPEALTDGLGTRWEIERNGFKPYACAAVLHPIIDAMIEVRAAGPVDPAAVQNIELIVNPNVMTISGVRAPDSGMQSKFSVFHTAAAALLDGDGGIAQYSDQRARAADVIRLRERVTIKMDESLRKDQTRATVVVGATSRRATIEHARGTVDNPMTDAELTKKFMANAEPVLGAARATQLQDRIWQLDEVDDMRPVVALCG